MMRKWPSTLLVKFLELYEKRPCLWNPKLPSYKDRRQRDDALEEIVEVMSQYVSDIDIHLVKAKIRSVRNAYSLERHKVLRSIQEGPSEKDIYTPTVLWYPVADRFLRYVVESKERTYSTELQGAEVQEITIADEEGGYDASYFAESAVGNSFGALSPPPVSKRSFDSTPSLEKEGKPVKKLKVYNITNAMTKAVNMLNKAVNTLQQMAGNPNALQAQCDEFELFGRLVAAHLRKLPLSTALDCQVDIMKYLVEQRGLSLTGAAAAEGTTTDTPPEPSAAPSTQS